MPVGKHSCGDTSSLPGSNLQNLASASEIVSCFAAGVLDVEAVALAGHSYGGATVTALCSQEPAFKCTVALDPWWCVLPVQAVP